jgi:uncharacterized protein YecE (DUF72 family)
LPAAFIRISAEDKAETHTLFGGQAMSVRLPFETVRALVWQLPPAEKQCLLHDLEADVLSELEQRKRGVLARHRQKTARSNRFMPKNEEYYQTMTPVIEVLATEFEPLAAAAVEAYEAFLESDA